MSHLAAHWLGLACVARARGERFTGVVALAAFLAVMACPAGASAQSITEFSAGITPGTTPGRMGATPYGIAAGPDGNLWFTEFNGNRVARITPAGVVTEFSKGIAP